MTSLICVHYAGKKIEKEREIFIKFWFKLFLQQGLLFFLRMCCSHPCIRIHKSPTFCPFYGIEFVTALNVT